MKGRKVWLSAEEWSWVRAMRAAKNCTRKRPYPTKDDALRAIVEKMNVIDNPAPPLRCYQCPTCQAWHLTKKTNWNDGKTRSDG